MLNSKLMWATVTATIVLAGYVGSYVWLSRRQPSVTMGPPRVYWAFGEVSQKFGGCVVFITPQSPTLERRLMYAYYPLVLADQYVFGRRHVGDGLTL